jgi:hypothetical protein
MEPRPELVSGSIGDFRPTHWDASAGQEEVQLRRFACRSAFNCVIELVTVSFNGAPS